MDPMAPILLPLTVVRSIEREALARGLSETDLVRRALRDYATAPARDAQLSLFAAAVPGGARQLWGRGG